jgi:RNA methyltransferase, TrmH family
MLTAADIKLYSSLKQKKFRESEGKFLIEGKHLVEECLSSAFRLEMLIIDDKTFSDKELLIKAADNNVKIEKTSAQNIRKISDTETPQGIIGVVNMKKPVKPDFNEMKLVVALDAVNDPGNLGTILRTAYWFGTDIILIGNGSVDIYNSKVLRSSQGAVFKTNFLTNNILGSELNNLSGSGFTVYCLTTHTNKLLSKSEINTKSVFVFGNEANGISEQILKSGYENVKIDSYSNCDSLNLAVSTGIVLDRYRNTLNLQ